MSSVAGSSSKKRAADTLDSDEGHSSKHKKIHPFFTKPSASNTSTSSNFVWQKSLGVHGTCLHGVNLSPPSSSKVAAFDLDGTIIKSSFSSGKNTKAPSWEWWKSDAVPSRLELLHSEGFSIVIISNQALRSAALVNWKRKIESFAASLPSTPFRIFAATAKDDYRKPMIGMWKELTRIYQENGIDIDKSSSFFVGDAAGRQYSGGKSDFASTDRKWAINVGLPFHTPEEFFLSRPPHTDVKLEGFNVSSIPELPYITPTDLPVIPEPRRQELVILVGYPCLGKTTLYRRLFEPLGYQHVNQDNLGTRNKCIKAVEEALKLGHSCVVDNTNRDRQTRKYYVEIARKFGLPIRCFLFTGSMELAWHNNLYRAYNLPPSVAEKGVVREVLPFLAFTSFKASFEEPELSEGLSEIRQVNWSFDGSEEEKKHWSMWLQIDGK
ncbi:PNK3P-domain-containing protein [Dendrothele bispora CBS 962.96]|uniref:PNK3P-domain-containing protein n=1 Tax=Dendrothele bispora (strain CBS 962.96) TaxID=1314807 RepID=A0A4S8MXW8_DENBC|nr:PNK3P-domain-containing protein [Dendrothele bispora CBS 962.96]